MDQLQHSSLVALGEGVQEPPCLSLTLCCLCVGEVGLASQGAGPHIAVAQEVTVEEFPAIRRGKVESTLSTSARNECNVWIEEAVRAYPTTDDRSCISVLTLKPKVRL